MWLILHLFLVSVIFHLVPVFVACFRSLFVEPSIYSVSIFGSLMVFFLQPDLKSLYLVIGENLEVSFNVSLRTKFDGIYVCCV